MTDSTKQDQGIAARLLNMERGELPLAVLSAAFFFFVLCGYFFLRPVREAMGVARGMDSLRWLFLVTSAISLLAVLAFGGVVARMNRRRFIPVAFLFVIACLFVFAGLIIQDVRTGGGLIGTDAETVLARGVGYTFYVWLTVINLFTTSLFWAFMVDIFDVGQGKRMFAFVGIGGTLGALAGAEATSIISGMTESSYLPAGLMLLACGCYFVAIATMLWLDRMAVRSRASRLEALPKGRRDATAPDGSDQDRRHLLGGSPGGRGLPLPAGGRALGGVHGHLQHHDLFHPGPTSSRRPPTPSASGWAASPTSTSWPSSRPS